VAVIGCLGACCKVRRIVHIRSDQLFMYAQKLTGDVFLKTNSVETSRQNNFFVKR